MYTGTLADVINEATIKAPDAKVAGIHHRINLNAANHGTVYQRTESGMNRSPYKGNEAYKAMYKARYKERLQKKRKLAGVELDDPGAKAFVRRVSAGSGVNYGVN